jgi:peptidoglycan/LPS O-acetylase OafA/YrhL
MLKHRNDIDGLRALAVGSVVLYHCGFARFFPGGFVGVDVFFVISGYLITGIVQKDIDNGRFSIVEFYNRRIRRIFPALMVVYAAVLAASFLLLMPSEASQSSRNILSSILFVSNIYFYTQTSYFDAASEFNALLHTWSLSVEEQFYIFLPIGLYLLSRFSRRTLIWILSAALVLSLAASAIMVSIDQSAGFYLVQYRAWELLIGSLLALNIAPSTTSRPLNEALGIAGLLLVAGSIFLLSADKPFPGLTAVPVCLGAALLLYSGQGNTLVAKLFSLPPVRLVGLASYSFYLWHWPVWVFGSLVHEPKGPLENLAYIAVSFGLALISWRFIEAPFRTNPAWRSSPRTLGFGSAAMVAAAGVTIALPFLSQGYWQVPDKVQAVAGFVNYDPNPNFRTGTCFLTSGFNKFEMFRKDDCLKLATDKPNYVLIGDSHAAHIYPGLLQNRDINVLQATASGCKPTDGAPGEKRCTDLVSYMFNDFLPKHHVDGVVLSGRWQVSDIPRLLSAVRKLKPYTGKLVVLGPIVEYDRALPRLLAQAMYEGDDALPARHHRDEPRDVDQKMRKALANSGATYVSLYDAVCPNGTCTLWTADNNPLQFDYGHMTAAGSRLILSRVRGEIIDKAGSNNLASLRARDAGGIATP